MSKVLSVAIPSYNSEAYMQHAIESVLPGGEDVEILIVDDGSKDRTAEIADEFERKYPGIVRAIHKENGGHGDAVMCGLHHAQGTYFRVVDSDDWLDSDVLLDMIAVLKEHLEPERQIDLFITNYIYDKVGARKKHVVHYANALPTDTVFSWEGMRNLRPGQYILMHSATYRRELLLECGLSLPKHTFYVDNLYVYVPMTHVNRMYYMDKVLYHYFIGRDDQSVHEEVMIRRLDQQMFVNRTMVEAVDVMGMEDGHRKQYMYRYVQIITVISSIMAILSGTKENLKKRDELWDFIREKSPALYKKLSRAISSWVVRAKTPVGRGIARIVYWVTDKIVGFN